MITTQAHIQTIELFLALILLMLFFRGPWQSILIDIMRQRLFEARDHLFMHAVNGKIDFNSNVYQSLRNDLNSSIRLCHESRFSYLLAYKIITSEKGNDQQKTSSIFDVIKKIEDAELRLEIEEAFFETTGLMVFFMILRSPFLFPVFIILLPFALLNFLLKGNLKSFLTKIDAAIMRNNRMIDA